MTDDQPCQHSYAFLRQDRTNIGYDRNPLYLVEDVFYCSYCCRYKRVKLREETPSRELFGKSDVVKTYPTAQ